MGSPLTPLMILLPELKVSAMLFSTHSRSWKIPPARSCRCRLRPELLLLEDRIVPGTFNQETLPPPHDKTCGCAVQTSSQQHQQQFSMQTQSSAQSQQSTVSVNISISTATRRPPRHGRIIVPESVKLRGNSAALPISVVASATASARVTVHTSHGTLTLPGSRKGVSRNHGRTLVLKGSPASINQALRGLMLQVSANAKAQVIVSMAHGPSQHRATIPVMPE
jgi:hypothetical protein